MDTEWLLSRKEIPHKFLCHGHPVNLPPPLKYTGKTQTGRHITKTLHSGIFYVEVDQFMVMNQNSKYKNTKIKYKIFCQIFDVGLIP